MTVLPSSSSSKMVFVATVLFAVASFHEVTSFSVVGPSSIATTTPTNRKNNNNNNHHSRAQRWQKQHQQQQQQQPNWLSGTSLSALPDPLLMTTDPTLMTDPALLHHAIQQHFMLLSDAAAAGADVPDGWWGSYLNIFKNLLEWVHTTIDPPLRAAGWDQTWGVSIAIFTAGMRTLLVPLSLQQSKSAEYMKALGPYQKEIRIKYKDNQDLMNRAIGKLYEDAKQNPLAGCFTSLAQLPILLGLYRGIRLLAVENELNEPFLWIPSLEGPVSPPDYRGLDWLIKGWTLNADNLPVPSLGWETTLAFLVMPFALVLGQAFTLQVLTPTPDTENMSEEEKATTEQSQRIFKFLPLLIGFFSLQVPAGLTIYWFTSNLYTVLQSLGARAYFAANPPKVELPDYWEQLKEGDDDNLTADERRKAQEAGLRVGPTLQEQIEEARYLHCYLERRPFRMETDAWQRYTKLNGDADEQIVLSSEFEEWVKKQQSLIAEQTIESSPTTSATA